MNLIEKFKKGLKGLNYGLPFGINEIDVETGGVQKEAIYAIAAGPKVGKTTFVDYAFVLQPFLYYLQELKKGNPKNLDIEWIYFSFEINRVKKEFKYITYFMYHDYGVTTFRHKDEVYPLSPTYLEGKKRDNDKELITVSEEHQQLVYKIYQDRIIPLFGEFDLKGRQIKKGLIRFVELKGTPTSLRKYIGQYSDENGKWTMTKYMKVVGRDAESGELITEEQVKREAWVPDNPNKFHIIITDHMRKVLPDKGMLEKQIVDTMVAHHVDFRNWCGFTFVDIIHINRNLEAIQRLKFNNEYLYPTGGDVKGTGNLSEEADYLFTMMNPNDDKYNITKHMGLLIKSTSNDELYPNLRTIHLVDSRDSECPVHFRSIMKGNINSFEPLVERSGYGY